MIASTQHIEQSQLQDIYESVSVTSRYGTEHGRHYKAFNLRAGEWYIYKYIYMVIPLCGGWISRRLST